MFMQIEGRWKFYQVYMENADLPVWFKNPNIPFKEGLLLFGFVHSWDPHYEGDIIQFYELYPEIFPVIKKYSDESIFTIIFTSTINKDINEIFDKLCYITRKNRFGKKKPEFTDTSKLLHGILPNLFVMWDNNIRRALTNNERNGECYSFRFLPDMQKMAKDILDTYIDDKGGDYTSSSKNISSLADEYPISKLLDEYNYLRYTKRKSLSEIRNIQI